MSEEQLKAAETEAAAQVEEKDGEAVVEEISDEDLEGVAAGVALKEKSPGAVKMTYSLK